MTVRILDADDVSRLRAAPLTGGGDLFGEAPEGFWTLRSSRAVGTGSTTYDRACDDLLSWRMHERAGFVVATSSPTVVADAVLVLGLGLGSARIHAPCRVVHVSNDEHECGFTYGTLPGHPVRGQERFAVRLTGSGQVVAEVVAVSQPAWAIARAAGAVTRAAQRQIAERYLTALAG